MSGHARAGSILPCFGPTHLAWVEWPCLDGTFLAGKYKGHMLTTIGVDVNNQLLLVTFAFVESENTDSWHWFLEHAWHMT
jgi:hypothetical protein